MTDGEKVFTLGVLSLVGFGVTGPIAWMRGDKLLYAIDIEGYDGSERNLITAGRICGVIGTVELLIWLLVLIGQVNNIMHPHPY